MGCGCGKRAQKALEVADKHGIPLPRVVRKHFERTARAEVDPNQTRRTSVRQGGR